MIEAARDLECRLVLVDPIALFYTGNENDRGQVHRLSSGASAASRRRSTARCWRARTRRAGLSTGSGDGSSTQWSNAFRSRLWLRTPEAADGGAPDFDARVLERMKANYASRGAQVRLRWQEGAFVTETPAGGLLAACRRRAAETVFLELLDAYDQQRRPVSFSPAAINYAPKVFTRSPKAAGYSKRELERAMEKLFEAREIGIVEYQWPGGGRRSLGTKLARLWPA